MAVAGKKKTANTKKHSAAKTASAKPVAKAAKAPAPQRPKLKPLTRPSMVSQLMGGGANAPKLPLRLQAVIDKSEIAEVIYNGARGLDRMDETLLRSVFHPDATVDLGPGVFQGTANDYVHWILAVLQQVRSTHHMIGNVRAELDGDAALVESYAHTHYRLDKPTGREDVFMGTRYLDRLERRPAGSAGVWKLMHRKQIIDWVRTEAVSDIFYHQNPDALWSYRTKTDPSYQMAQFPGSQSGGKLPAFLGRHAASRCGLQ